MKERGEEGTTGGIEAEWLAEYMRATDEDAV